MASFKEKLDKNGNRIYEVQASNGRGRRVWRTFRPEPTWSKRTIQRELQKFAAELEQQLADGEVLTREETAQKAAADVRPCQRGQHPPGRSDRKRGLKAARKEKSLNLILFRRVS